MEVLQGRRLHIPYRPLVILDDIRIDFKKDSKTGAYKHGNYLVPTRTKDNLPAEIKGKATFHQWTYQYSNSYEVWDGNKTYDAEFINRTWYWILWDSNAREQAGGYRVNPAEDAIISPATYGLGTEEAPYIDPALK